MRFLVRVVIFVLLLGLPDKKNLADATISNVIVKRDLNEWKPDSYAEGIRLIADLQAIYHVTKLFLSGDEERMKKTLEHISAQLDAVEEGVKENMEEMREFYANRNEQEDQQSASGSDGHHLLIMTSLVQFEMMRSRLFALEQIIRNSYEHWRAWVTTRTDKAREDFVSQSSDLIKAINGILDAMLGTSIFGSDLLVVTQLVHQSHPRNFRTDAEVYMELVKIGASILAASYYLSSYDTAGRPIITRKQLGGGSEHQQQAELVASQNYWLDQLSNKEEAARKRVSRIETECRDESGVSYELTQILTAAVASSSPDEELSNRELAKLMADFLKDKYDTKSWVVVVYDSDSGGNSAASLGYFHRVISASGQGKNVLAASLGPNDRWTAEERSTIKRTINSYCQQHPSSAPGYNYRCQETSGGAPVVANQLNRLMPKPVRLAVLAASSTHPANTVAPNRKAPVDLVYLTFKTVHHRHQVVMGSPSGNGLQVLVLPSSSVSTSSLS